MRLTDQLDRSLSNPRTRQELKMSESQATPSDYVGCVVMLAVVVAVVLLATAVLNGVNAFGSEHPFLFIACAAALLFGIPWLRRYWSKS